MIIIYTLHELTSWRHPKEKSSIQYYEPISKDLSTRNETRPQCDETKIKMKKA